MRFLNLVSAAVVLLLLYGCWPEIAQQESISCSETDVRAVCILQAAEETLGTITDPFNWSTSAVELALAQDSNGDAQTAIAHFKAALLRANSIEAAKRRATAIGDIALALSKLKRSDDALAFLDDVARLANTAENADVKSDIVGKLITARAVHGSLTDARAMAYAMPTDSETQDAYRGRTQREVAAKFAKAGDFKGAIETIGDMTAAFTYYSAVARTDVAAIAVNSNRPDIAEQLFSEAAAIAADQDNGYFSGAILRDIGYALVRMGQLERADDVFAQALEQTRIAKSLQEQARSISRVATRLADCGLEGRNRPILAEALARAKQVKSDVMRQFSVYEIAGSAAFSGDFELARGLVADLPETPFGSAVSLRSAGMRDLAWGLARAGKMEDALETAKAISSQREKVHALSRLVRLINDPDMAALPRYL